MAAIMAVCPSGQREQTVNLPAQPTQVRTLAPPRDVRPPFTAKAQWAGVFSYGLRAPGRSAVRAEGRRRFGCRPFDAGLPVDRIVAVSCSFTWSEMDI